MIDREPGLLPELTPPPGGLARLRARRDELQRSNSLTWGQVVFTHSGVKAYGPLLAGACTAMLLILWWPQQLPTTVATDRLIGAHSTGNSFRLLEDAGAAQQLVSHQPGVRLYWTDSLMATELANSAQ